MTTQEITAAVLSAAEGANTLGLAMLIEQVDMLREVLKYKHEAAYRRELGNEESGKMWDNMADECLQQLQG